MSETAKIVTALSQAHKGLNKSHTDLSKMVITLQSTLDVSETITSEIEMLESRRDTLKEDFNRFIRDKLPLSH